MLDHNTYKLIHLVGLTLLLLGIGAIMLGTRSDGARPRGATALHGIGLLLMIVAGFGMMARLGLNSFPWPGWLFGKLAVWVVFGVLPVMAKRGIVRGVPGVLLTVALVVVSAWLAIYKPF